jgi:hypothetical protein
MTLKWKFNFNIILLLVAKAWLSLDFWRERKKSVFFFFALRRCCSYRWTALFLSTLFIRGGLNLVVHSWGTPVGDGKHWKCFLQWEMCCQISVKPFFFFSNHILLESAHVLYFWKYLGVFLNASNWSLVNNRNHYYHCHLTSKILKIALIEPEILTTNFKKKN